MTSKAVSPSLLNRSLTPKGMTTRATILDTAHQVFKEMGYYGTSISEVTRRCGISMGNFYQYFKNKEQVFLELSDLIRSRFMDRARSLPVEGLPFEERLLKGVQLLYEHTRENFAFHRILGESELTDRVTIAYYEAIARHYRNFIRREARAGNIRSLEPNMIAYGLIGICYFHSLDWGERKKTAAREVIRQITDLILQGINGPAPWKKPLGDRLLSVPHPVPLHSVEGEPLTKGENTRQAIFRAAERVIGQHGINRANISEITRAAGVAQGTFYVHFGSKRDLIDGLVKYINSQMRRELQRTVARTQDRRDAERVGALAFYKFLQQHREIYRVVPECEMIDREVSLWYYKKIAQGYIQGLEQGIERGEIRNLPAVFLARSLMGFTHFIGLKWIVWNSSNRPEIPTPLQKDIIEFLLFGLQP
ncbi:MAG TPA: TetR/AcrR family transcriptional regulator [Thermodesulfobacteriota bacterium]|nr:TetR/AcrR family transcriptional regulator [Thermodesulfobacteriota bacterium]